MTKLVIGKDAEKEPEIHFWLEPNGDVVSIMADAGECPQILAEISPDGKIRAIRIVNQQLIKFFGTDRPFANLS